MSEAFFKYMAFYGAYLHEPDDALAEDIAVRSNVFWNQMTEEERAVAVRIGETAANTFGVPCG